MMKKVLCWVLLLALLLMQFPIAEAAGSKTNDDIPKVVIEEDEPDNKPDDDPGPTIEIVDDTPEIDELIEDMQATYTLTIYYRYEDGTTAAETYVRTLSEGDTYDVPSPVIPGYRASLVRVAGTMPGHDVVYTVIYVREETEIIEEPGTPLGLGQVYINIGDCLE